MVSIDWQSTFLILSGKNKKNGYIDIVLTGTGLKIYYINHAGVLVSQNVMPLKRSLGRWGNGYL